MFSRLKKKFRSWQLMNKANQQKNSPPGKEEIPESALELKEKLRQVFAGCDDFRLREIIVGGKKGKLNIAFVDNLISRQAFNDNLLKPLMDPHLTALLPADNQDKIIACLKKNILNLAEIKEQTDFLKSVENILNGESVIYIEGSNIALVASIKGWEARTVQEPQTETVVRGPREGFVEDLGVNCALIRRKIRNPNLKMELRKIGQKTGTNICICYLKGIADEELVKEVKKRISQINIDAVLESGYLEEMIEDNPFTFFPLIGNSEKPDIVAGKILEGRVAIICDGTPFVLTVPYLFLETLQASEDYYTRAMTSTVMRILRIVSLFISLLLPGIYVAFLSFHQATLPLNFLITIAASREGIPFAPFTEALFMGLTFEILQEAGIRMPRPIGQSISIVGALVIGEASVRAGLVSDPMVIVTAITAISTFILPPLQRMLPYFRLIFIILANILGLLGITLGLIAVITHMCTLRSFGIPYLTPFAPSSPLDMKDTLFRFPHWLMATRPRALTWQETGRAKYRMDLASSTKNKIKLGNKKKIKDN
jgi:spore germination protein KA